MKIFVRFMIFALVLGVAGPFFLKRPDGQPWMDSTSLIPETAPAERYLAQIKATVLSWFGDAQVEPIGKTKVYRWKSAEGFWQLSDTPPDAADAEVIFVDPDTNLIQGLRAQPAAPEPVDKSANDLPSGIPLPLTISPGKVQKLMDDAKAVQEKLNQRNSDLDAIVTGKQPERER